MLLHRSPYKLNSHHDNRRALAWEVKACRSGTAYQELNIQKQRTVITKRIKKFRGLQLGIFMPQLREYLTPEQLKHLDAPEKLTAEETKLFLPFKLKASDCALPRACLPGIADGEERLRMAECRDSLNELCRGLRMRSAGVLFTVRNVIGQNPTTQAKGL